MASSLCVALPASTGSALYCPPPSVAVGRSCPRSTWSALSSCNPHEASVTQCCITVLEASERRRQAFLMLESWQGCVCFIASLTRSDESPSRCLSGLSLSQLLSQGRERSATAMRLFVLRVSLNELELASRTAPTENLCGGPWLRTRTAASREGCQSIGRDE